MVAHRRRGGVEESEESKKEMEGMPPKEEMESESDEEKSMGGRRRRHVPAFLPKSKRFKTKTLRNVLRKAGIKATGNKRTLRLRALKAKLIRGGQGPASMSLGAAEESAPVSGGGYAGDGNASYATMEGPGLVGQSYMLATGGRRHSVKTKTLKKLLKKAGLRTSGKKSTLTKRAKKAHLLGGAATSSSGSNEQAGTVRPDGVWDSPNQ